ncbi:MAG: hypothetical protein A2W28_11560 [Gammaproteobacteria bacterium RBG_16_51_14]|nr:MAG: hypothetical protein A2W28_11560 [Gammaproteobacteria bacterium RBG_16_51_14]
MRKLLFRNFRLIYRISHWMRHRFTEPGLLIVSIMILAGIFGIDTRRTLAFQIFALLAMLLLLAFISNITFRGRFRVQRILPDFATAGQSLDYRCSIENLSSRKEKGLVLIDELDTSLPAYSEFLSTRDPGDNRRNWFDRVIGYPRMMYLIQHKRGGAIRPVPIDFIPAKGQTDSYIRLTPIRRGYLNFQSTRLARPDPLGLFRAVKTITARDTLLVLPRLYRVPPIRLQGKRKYQRGGMSMASSVGDSQEFMSLRDYRPGDPMRSIHWRSYAKRTQPVVKECQDEFFVRQGLILDTFPGQYAEAVFEEAVSVAASFVMAVRPQDALLDLMFVGTEAYRFTSGRGMSTTENMLEILACVEPCREQSFDRLQHLILEHGTGSSGFICLLLGWDAQRRSLIRLLEATGIPCLVLIITSTGSDDITAINTMTDLVRIHVLTAGAIQAGLDEMVHTGRASAK